MNAGAAKLKAQSELNAQNLLEELNHLRDNRELLIEMSNAARSLAKPDSAKIVAKYCIEAINV